MVLNKIRRGREEISREGKEKGDPKAAKKMCRLRSTAHTVSYELKSIRVHLSPRSSLVAYAISLHYDTGLR